MQYLNLKFCNDALSELIQCELGEVDFSQIKRSTLKKAGPDLCFQPLFKLVDLANDEEESEDQHVENQPIPTLPKGVRFASAIEHDDLEKNIRDESENTVKIPNEFHEERPLTSGLIFLPSLSKKGIIAIKNPLVTIDDD